MALQGAAPAGAQIQAKRRELKEVRRELDETRREIEEYERREGELKERLDRLETRNAEARRRLSSIQKTLGAAQRRKEDLSGRLITLGRATGFWRSSWEEEAAGYQARLASRADRARTSGLWAEALAREALREKARLLRGLEGLGRETAEAEEESRRRADELLERSRRAEAERDRERRRYLRTKSAMQDAKERRAAAVKKARELEESAKALTSLVERLAREARMRPTGQGLKAPHSLPWPAAGRVVQAFGRRRNPELDTWVIHQGIRLETRARAAVSAVAAGRVIFSGPFRSYGEVVIVEHGADFFSIYGELGQRLKSRGARVAEGEALGRAGGDGPEGSLYLEFRRGTEAVDPVPWLERKR